MYQVRKNSVNRKLHRHLQALINISYITKPQTSATNVKHGTQTTLLSASYTPPRRVTAFILFEKIGGATVCLLLLVKQMYRCIMTSGIIADYNVQVRRHNQLILIFFSFLKA